VATTLAPTSLWTAAQCSWAEEVMWRDEDLDSLESADLAAGGDLDGLPASDAGYYAQAAQQWLDIGTWLTTACTSGQAVPATEAARAIDWMEVAITTHQTDEELTPANAGWDNEWIANYQGIIAMLDAWPA
jgi:hypothetical protein